MANFIDSVTVVFSREGRTDGRSDGSDLVTRGQEYRNRGEKYSRKQLTGRGPRYITLVKKVNIACRNKKQLREEEEGRRSVPSSEPPSAGLPRKFARQKISFAWFRAFK